MGSLSHYIKQRATGYEALPPFPEQPPPSDVRNVESIPGEEALKMNKNLVSIIYLRYLVDTLWDLDKVNLTGHSISP